MGRAAALFLVLLLSPLPPLCRGEAGGSSGVSRETHDAIHNAGMGRWEGEARHRFGDNPATYGHMSRYGGGAAPINGSNDLHYIQEHMASSLGFAHALDNALTIVPPPSSTPPSIDPGGGTTLASPGKTVAPWEVGVTPALVQTDLAINPSDPYALRVAGIQDSYNADYARALPQLRAAIDNGQRDGTTLSFGAMAAFHQGDMKSAAAWAQEALAADPGGPWAKLADSVRHLTEKEVHGKAPPQAQARRAPGDDDLSPAAVGPLLLPNKAMAVSEPMKGPEGVLRDARDALAMKDYAEVERKASTLFFLDPHSAEALRLRAAAEIHEGKYPGALADAERGLGLAPGAAAFIEASGIASARLGDYGAARLAAEAMLRADPASAAGWRLLAFASAGLGDRQGMEEALAHAAAADPAAAALLARARALPTGSDALSLFTDALLLGESYARTAPAARSARRLAETVFAVCLGTLGGLALALAALTLVRRRRRSAAAPAGLDLSAFSAVARRAGPAPAAPAEPARVGPFRILASLGRGGMGVVYKAEDTRLGRVVALKRLREEVAGDPRERARFLKEARIVSALEHPGVVRIFSVHEEPEDLYLVFELVDGMTLAQALAARGRLPLGEARGLLAQACDAVAYAHSKGVVHRDLKPANIMVDARGRVRVMDFGVARAAQDAVTRLSAQGASSGTPAYMSPEQEDGSCVPASDVYALGVCLYEMLTGRPPFSGGSLELYQAKRAGRFAPLGQGLDGVLARALHPDPARRLGDPRELAAALAGVPA